MSNQLSVIRICLFPFSRRERVRWVRDGSADRIEQRLVIHWFAKISRDSAGQRARTGFLGVMPGDDHDWQPDARFREPRLDREAVDSRHVQVEDNAVRLMGFQGIEELGPGGERFHVEVGRAQQPPEGDAHGFLVIHDCSQGPSFAHKRGL